MAIFTWIIQRSYTMKKVFLLYLVFTVTQLYPQHFYLGADFSYLNEMEDCGAVYYENQEAKDPYEIFAGHQAGIVRYRLWHNPGWTDYSTFNDVKKAIGRAKNAGFSVLLDFHYSDTWTDPTHQLIPAAWEDYTDLNILGDSLFQYTFNTLNHLQNEGLLPDMVQIGNEINGNILVKEGEPLYPNDWERNVFLLNHGIEAVDSINQIFGTAIKTVIHIAKPENAVSWFTSAAEHGFTGFDIIGLSYYPGWSVHDVRSAAATAGQLKTTFLKEVMIVETGYPWTLAWDDNANNMLGSTNFLKTFGNSTSADIQRDVLTELAWLMKENGGSGIIYWEPAWVSTNCSTQWGVGSHWENATFFDFDNHLHQGIEFLEYDYSVMPPNLNPVMVTFKVDMTGADTTNGVYVTGDFTGETWQFRQMQHIGKNVFIHKEKIPGRSVGAYIFYNKPDWNIQSREVVPPECALQWNTHREYVIRNIPEEFAFKWSSCETISGTGINDQTENRVQLFPNPATASVHVISDNPVNKIEILDLSGRSIKTYMLNNLPEADFNTTDFPAGVYYLKVFTTQEKPGIHKLFIQ